MTGIRITLFICLMLSFPALLDGQVRTRSVGSPHVKKQKRTTISIRTLVKTTEFRPVPADGKIRVADIAKVWCDDKTRLRKIERLDLGNWPEAGNEEAITKQRLKIRLMLSDLEGNIYYTGSDVVMIRGEGVSEPTEKGESAKEKAADAQPDLLLDLLRTATMKKASFHFQVEPSDVIVEFTGTPQMSNARQNEWPELENASIEILNEDLIGTVPLEFIVLNEGKAQRGKVNASLIIKREVAVTTRRVAVGDLFSKENVRLEKKFFTKNVVDDVMGAEVYGEFCGRLLRPNHQIRSTELGKSNRIGNDIVVKKGDLLDATISGSAFKIQAFGLVAETAGRIGQYIQVRSPERNKLLWGKVISPSEVEIRNQSRPIVRR